MDRRQIIKSYFQERHWSNEKLRVLFLEPIVEELGLDADYAEMIQLFGSVDEIPSDFLEGLGDSVGYEYLQEEDPDIQREIIKRVFRIYRNRAKRSSIERVLESSTDRNWIGDDLTLYKGPLEKGYQHIWIPREKIFYHDKSFHDSGDAFADCFEYNNGVINFELQKYDERTIEMLEMQVPGGVRWNISQLVWFYDPERKPPSYFVAEGGVGYDEEIMLVPEHLYIPSENLARFDQLNYVGLVRPNHKVFGGKLLQMKGSSLVAGELGDEPGQRFYTGAVPGEEATYIRSGRFVTMSEVIEEVNLYLPSTPISGTEATVRVEEEK